MMRKWLIMLLLLVLALTGLAFWLAGSVDNARPEAGEVRTEIGNVF
jgi:hypothetical protein